jgi:regulatory protein
MRITNIEYQKNNKRVNIYIDNKFAFGMSDELRFKFGLSIDDEINQDFIDNVIKSEEQMKVTNAAFNLLSFRQRSEKELCDALKRKGFEDSYISHTINYLKENNYLDDKKFAKSFIYDKQNLNKYGPNKIRYELYKKGISKDIIESTVIKDSNTEYDMALELAAKKLTNYKSQDKASIYRKLGNLLQRKGYSYDVILKVLDNLIND